MKTLDILEESGKGSGSIRPEMRPHAFVIMPFGKKKGGVGIRHAFRKRGIVHIQAGRAYMPFDVFNVRTIPYHITTEGVPDPAFLEKDKAAISRVTRDTWASDVDAIHSPVFNILTGLVNRKGKPYASRGRATVKSGHTP